MIKPFQYFLYWYAAIASVGVVNTPDTFWGYVISTASLGFLFAMSAVSEPVFKEWNIQW